MTDDDDDAALTARELLHSEWSRAELLAMDAAFCTAMQGAHEYAKPAELAGCGTRAGANPCGSGAVPSVATDPVEHQGLGRLGARIEQRRART